MARRPLNEDLDTAVAALLNSGDDPLEEVLGGRVIGLTEGLRGAVAISKDCNLFNGRVGSLEAKGDVLNGYLDRGELGGVDTSSVY